jgi:hypothetical protein
MPLYKGLVEKIVKKDKKAVKEFKIETDEFYKLYEKVKVSNKTKCLFLCYIEKVGNKVEVVWQKSAADKAGKFQNKEIQAVLRQSRIDPPRIFEGLFTFGSNTP